MNYFLKEQIEIFEKCYGFSGNAQTGCEPLHLHAANQGYQIECRQLFQRVLSETELRGQIANRLGRDI